MNKRIKYLILVIITIILGLLSRKVSIIPLATGDFLWAIMIYFGIRFLNPKVIIEKSAIISIVICYIVEISQLYQEPWINQIRSTTLGHLVLGQGFLYSDLLAYSLGVLLVYSLEKLLSKK